MPTKPAVLVVDDSTDSRRMLVEYLVVCRAFGVWDAKAGDEAIAVARRVRPDVILMDLSKPGIDGWEATRQLG